MRIHGVARAGVHIWWTRAAPLRADDDDDDDDDRRPARELVTQR
jgi:hypothetical protein